MGLDIKKNQMTYQWYNVHHHGEKTAIPNSSARVIDRPALRQTANASEKTECRYPQSAGSKRVIAEYNKCTVSYFYLSM